MFSVRHFSHSRRRAGLHATRPAFKRTEGLVAAMLLYNIAVGGLLSYARVALGMSGVGLLPAVIAHSALAGWCVALLASQMPEEKTRTPD